MKIKKGDSVIVLAGKSKGTTSTVLRALPSIGKVLIKDVNVLTKFIKPRVRGEKTKMEKREFPIDSSNVSLIDPKSKKPTRTGFKMEKGKKVRIAKKSGEKI